ncbi:hypothetical protein [Cohnella soli]|uniref:Uncharacterized protein n=1 Tax=Cohnella soli TaxID=425005 RepID=A0ABW0HL88_9BACL
MSNSKRITDLTGYNGILPYDSELFGVYQSLIGWRSKRMLDRLQDREFPFIRLSKTFENSTRRIFNADNQIESGALQVGRFAEAQLVAQDHSILLNEISLELQKYGKVPQDADEWQHIANEGFLKDKLNETVRSYYNSLALMKRQSIYALTKRPNESEDAFTRRKEQLVDEMKREITAGVEKEVQFAGVVSEMIGNKRIEELNRIFYKNLEGKAKEEYHMLLDKAQDNYRDPYLTFDPAKNIDNVSVSPLGIVHLYRQFFFELDSFLGTPASHVWLSPGSTVELIETSTRKTIIEKTTESFIETVKKSEDSLVTQDDLSESVKEDNKSDLKLGFSTTVNQYWASGNMSATGSLNMDKTQQLARESVHKQMRQQTQKLSTEIRQNFKSTFKVVTETTDTSSKRYVLNNNTTKLINYELRRKMRQIGVQVQDVGTFLCWQTFVDEPGADLGLANLVHIATPIDLVVPANPEAIPVPPDQPLFHKVNCIWTYEAAHAGFIGVGIFDLPPAPNGFEIVRKPGHVILPATQLSARGDDFAQVWAFGARFTIDDKVEGTNKYG